MSESRVQRAIRQGLSRPGGMRRILDRLEDEQITSVDDAVAIAEGLATLAAPLRGRDGAADFFALCALVQQVGSKGAFEAMRERVAPEIVRIVRGSLEGATDVEEDSLLFGLKQLAALATEEGIELLVETARRGVAEDSYSWVPILGTLSDEEHPRWREVVEGLRSPLPDGFIGIAYLDLCNTHARHGNLELHPFDVPEGHARLRDFLDSDDQDLASYAYSATTALPFISDPARDELLRLAAEHLDPDVRVEGAWAAAKVGREEGIERLRAACLDVNTAMTAAGLLEELGLEDRIPEAAEDLTFQAMASMSHWLQHPSEFGAAPDEIELSDHRTIWWPPTRDERPVWLFTYRYIAGEDREEDEVGVGMVGSITFALFGETSPEMPPEDIYGLHCCWELTINGDERALPDEGRDAKLGWAMIVSRA